MGVGSGGIKRLLRDYLENTRRIRIRGGKGERNKKGKKEKKRKRGKKKRKKKSRKKKCFSL